MPLLNPTQGERSAQAPASNGSAITPSDSTVLSTTRAIYVGGDGNLAVVFADGTSTVTLNSVKAGTIVPIRVTKVMAATTATGLVGLY